MRWLARFRRWLEEVTGRGAVEAPPVPVDISVTRPPEMVRPAASPLQARRSRATPVALGLALQGGGAHGAFTWGVLDRLLDEPRLAFPVITGASAGALNGAMLVSGHAGGGRQGAQKALADLWEGIGRIGAIVAPLQGSARMATDLGLTGAGMMQAMMRMWSPAQLNPFNINPLRDLLGELVDVEALRRSRAMRLHVSATEVETGAARIFTGEALSIDVLMASACLPTLYQAVPIDGVPYWDGGYSANPPLTPLVPRPDDDAAVGEALLIQINPERRPGAPVTASDILHRVSEITFNASLIAELRHVASIRSASDPSEPALRLHRIALHDALEGLTGATAGSLDDGFHRTLRDHGRRAADRWLETEWRTGRVPTPVSSLLDGES